MTLDGAFQCIICDVRVVYELIAFFPVVLQEWFTWFFVAAL